MELVQVVLERVQEVQELLPVGPALAPEPLPAVERQSREEPGIVPDGLSRI